MRVESGRRPSSALPKAVTDDEGQSAGSFQALTGKNTPMSGAAAASHLGNAWQKVFGEALHPQGLSIVWAQWALETGQGAAMRGFNFGGIKGAAQGGGSALYPTREGAGANSEQVLARFRTYATPEHGARDYLQTLDARFPGTIDAVRAGDSRAFVDALHRGGYFTASRDDYERAIVHLSKRYLTSDKSVPANLDVSAPEAPLRNRLAAVDAEPEARAIAPRNVGTEDAAKEASYVDHVEPRMAPKKPVSAPKDVPLPTAPPASPRPSPAIEALLHSARERYSSRR